VSALVIWWMVFKASLLSTGGMGNIPSLHDDLISRGWVTERRFAESLAVGQTAPGPSGLWVVSLGYLMAGLPGALSALAAITLPPLLVLAVARLYRRIEHHPIVFGFVRGLGLAVVGIFAVVLIKVLRGNGIEPRSLVIAGVSGVLGLSRRVPMLAVIVGAAVVGAILYR
jgi:chromate transporter